MELKEFFKNVGVGLIAISVLFGIGVLFQLSNSIELLRDILGVIAVVGGIIVISAWAGMAIRETIRSWREARTIREIEKDIKDVK